MIRFEKILIPTDFSELASHALRYACNLARTYRADLHALHVVVRASEIPVAPEGAAGMGALNGLSGVPLLESAREVIERKGRELHAHVEQVGAGLPVKPVEIVRLGVVWEEIVRYADEAGIDLIVIGSHARGVMTRILLGSTSKSVLEHVARPVLMVPIAAVAREAAESTPALPAANTSAPLAT